MGEKPYAVIVGGASGIGAAITHTMADHGYAVVVGDRNIAAANTLVDQLGGRHTAVGLDVSDEAGVATLFESMARRPGRFEIAVNCAGINALGLVTELPVAKFRRVVDVCLTGAYLVIQHAARHIADNGAIISLSSLNARQPGIGMGAYCAAKAGLSMLTEVAALELAPRVRVNAVAPGLVRTPLTAAALDVPGVEGEYVENIPLGRPGTPTEVAEAVMYLARAQWITGEVLDLNGGANMMRYPNVHAHFSRAGLPHGSPT